MYSTASYSASQRTDFAGSDLEEAETDDQHELATMLTVPKWTDG